MKVDLDIKELMLIENCISKNIGNIKLIYGDYNEGSQDTIRTLEMIRHKLSQIIIKYKEVHNDYT